MQVKFGSHFSGEKSVSYGPGNTVHIMIWNCACA